MALKTCPTCHTKLEYAGQPGDYGFDQRCPKCNVTRDCGDWEVIKKEIDANKPKREKKEVLRAEERMACGTCVACAFKLLSNGIVTCPITTSAVKPGDIACGKYVRHVPPFHNCSNCRNGIDGLMGNEKAHGCKAMMGFPSDGQWSSYTSCEKFDPKQALLREAMEYYKKKSEMLEKMSPEVFKA